MSDSCVPVSGDLKFATGGGLQVGCDLDGAVVVEIEAGNGEIRLGDFWFFFEGEDSAVGCELDDAISAGLGDMVAEDGGAIHAGVSVLHGFGEMLAVENVVTEDEGGGSVADEFGADVVGLGEALGAGLLGVLERDSELRTVAEEALEEGQILGGGNQQNLADAREHEHRQRVVNHRLVVDRHELLADGDGERVEAGAGASGEDDAAAVGVVLQGHGGHGGKARGIFI